MSLSAPRTVALALLIFCSFGVQPALAKGIGKTDTEIAQILIRQSIMSYSGSCPCPYSRARNGSKCGKRSAYSKPGGEDPLCYRSDV